MKQRKVKFLVFGNVMLKDDSLPLRMIGRLRSRFPECQFEEFDPNENLQGEGRDLSIIDSVEGIKEVVIITDIDRIQASKIVSVHDFDLAYNLKLLKKLGYIDSVRIFGVPMKIDEDTAFKQLSDAISASLS